jgi:carboxyl-terminal processing protease
LAAALPAARRLSADSKPRPKEAVRIRETDLAGRAAKPVRAFTAPRNAQVFVPIALLFLFSAETLPGQSKPDPVELLAPPLKTMIDVFAAVEQEAADPVNPDAAFFVGAIPSMLRTLDPHSSFFDPDQFRQLQEMERSEQKGFGSIVSVLPGRVIVLQTLPGTPADKASLSAGDEIVAVNGIALARLEPEQLIQVLSESRQHEATLDIHRPGDAGLTRIVMSPELVKTPTVDRAFMLAPGIGYLRITEFEEPTGGLVKEKIEALGGSALQGLVLDLRDNPGGAVTAAVETASLFLKPEQLIFTVKGRSAKAEEVSVMKYNRPYTFPLVVLVNERTASASEIVSGALQDHDRATILGIPTYGKGLVQQVYPLSGNAGMALTTAFYYTPSGRSIQRPLSGGQLDAATVVDKGPYKTDSGREVRGGGGIQPDQVVLPEQQSRLRLAMDASGVITSFASEYLRSHEVAEGFEVTPEMLDGLNAFCAAHSIQPGVGEWLADQRWIQSRLHQEIDNLKFGVEQGDQVEMQRDPTIAVALQRLTAQ